MREIKFRGYAIEEMINSQWLYGFGVKDIDYVDGTEEWHLHTLNGVYQVEPKSIGQYTGLKDKNGTEIYEGDVVSYKSPFTDSERLMVMEWSKEDACFCFGSVGTDYASRYSAVIGNIYEHSHLLEVD